MNNQNNKQDQSYKKYFVLALSLHCFVLAMMVFNNASQETIQITAQEPQNNTPQEIVAAIVHNEVPKKIVEKIDSQEKNAETARLAIAKIEQEEQIRLANIEAEKSAKELEKKKAEKLLKLVKEKQEQEKIEQAKIEQIKIEQIKIEQAKIEAKKIAEQNKERLLTQKRIAQAQQAAQELAQQQVVAQQAAAAQALAQQAQNANDHAQLLRTIDRYALLMRAKIHQHWRRPVGIDNLYKCKVAVKLGNNGEVISAKVLDSSGNIEFDRSAELAIRKSSPLPLPAEEKMRVPFNNFTFTFDPQMA